MKEPQQNQELLNTLLNDHENAKGPYTITPYWQTYNQRIVREVLTNGISHIQSNYKLLKGFAEGGTPTITKPNNDLKRFVFESLSKLPLFKKIVNEHERLITNYYKRYLELKIKNAKLRLATLEKKYGKIPFKFDLDVGHPDDAFEWNSYQVTAKIVPYLERAYYFYDVVGEHKPRSILEIGSGLGLSTLCHLILNDELEHITNVDIPATLYLSTQFLKSFEKLKVTDYLSFKKDEEKQNKKDKSTVSCLCIPPWAIEKIEQKHDWFHNAYSFQEMEPNVVKNYMEISSKFIQKGYWIMSSIGGHAVGAGGQKENVSLSLIENLVPANSNKMNLPESDLEEMSDKVTDTLIFKR